MVTSTTSKQSHKLHLGKSAELKKLERSKKMKRIKILLQRDLISMLKFQLSVQARTQRLLRMDLMRCHLLRKALKLSRSRRRWSTSTLQKVKTFKMILRLIFQNKKTKTKVMFNKEMTLNTVQTTFDHKKEQ